MSRRSEGGVVNGQSDHGGDGFLNLVGGVFLAAAILPSVLLLCEGMPAGMAIAAVPVSLVILVIFSFISGTDIMDVLVTSVIFIVLTAILIPSTSHSLQHDADTRIASMRQKIEAKQIDIDIAKLHRRAHAKWLKWHVAKRGL